MNFAKMAKGIWLAVAGFFIGSCKLLGLNPLAVSFLGATCLTGGNYMLTYLGVLLGLSLNFSLVHTVRYGIMMLGLLILLNMRTMATNRGKTLTMSFFTGCFSTIINLSVYYFVDNILNVEQVILEGILIFSATVIFSYGINVVEKDYVKIAVDSQAALSVMSIGAAVLYGMQREVGGVFALSEAFALFSILFTIYKFGFGIGMSWTVIAGGLISAQTGNTEYLTVWLIITLFAYAFLNILRGGRAIFVILFGAVYYGCGMMFYDFLLNETSLKALISALFIFLFAPAKYMLKVDEKIKNGELAENSPEWGRLIINRVNGLASAFKRIEYTLASDAGTGIGFNEVGEIIEGFANQLDKQVPLRKTIEAKILEELGLKGIEVKNLILIKNKEDRYEIYITARVRRGKLVHAEAVREILEKQMNVRLELKDESRSIVSRNYEILCYHEKPVFICQTAVRRLSRYEEEICGDNFYIGDILDGQKLVIIADGMGNGEKASEDSSALIEALEELLMAGFDNEMSIRLVNSYLSDRNRGETFTTLDMLLLDLHTGYGKLYKQGAATTFIRRGEWLEMVKSTSLPVGVVEGAVCEKCSKKFFDNDIIVMVSDGVLESIIFENKEDYMNELLMGMSMDNPEDIASEILDRIRSVSGNRMKDDATIIVCKVVKTL